MRELDERVAVITGGTSGTASATAAPFLASADSGLITGAALPVDGGLTQV